MSVNLHELKSTWTVRTEGIVFHFQEVAKPENLSPLWHWPENSKAITLWLNWAGCARVKQSTGINVD